MEFLLRTITLVLLAIPAVVLAQDATDAAFETIVCPASEQYPRHSEGDVEMLRDGRLLLAWTRFEGGFADDAAAVVAGKTSDDGGRTWGEPFVLQPNTGRRNVMSASLLRRRDGELLLFYLRKDGPDDLSVWMRRCLREPDAWSTPSRVSTLPGYHVMNNDRVIELRDGRLLAPVAMTPNIAKQYGAQEAFCYLSDDGGETWRPGSGRVGFERSAAMEPGVVDLRDGRVLMILRTTLGYVYASHSNDRGDTWSEPTTMTLRTADGIGPVVAPAAPASIARIPSTGDLMLIWIDNPKGARAGWKERTPLTAAVSRDEGNTWTNARDLENDPNCSYGYCSITFAGDRANRAFLTYYVWRDKGQRGFDGASLKLKSLPPQWFYSRER